MPRTALSLALLAASSPASAFRLASRGQYEEQVGLADDATTGFVFVGIGGDDFCSKANKAVTNLKDINLKCRGLPVSDPGYCNIAFVGNHDGAAKVQKDCPTLFDAVHDVDFAPCGIALTDVSNLPVCIRAMGKMPFTYNLQMEMDTLAVSNEVEHVFDVLRKGFDLTASFECCARHVLGGYSLAEDTLLHGWEIQTGVMGYKNSEKVKAHAQKVVQIYKPGSVQYPPDLTSGNQNAETQAMAQSQIRFLPLPPNFNIRSFTAVGYKDMPMAVAHWHFKLDQPLETLREEANKLVTSFRHMFTNHFAEMSSKLPFLFRMRE